MNGKKLWNIFRDYMEYFLVYAIIGWVYESVWCCMIYHHRGFINRGYLFGPWLPIYGVGFFVILGIFTLLKVKKPGWVFVVRIALVPDLMFGLMIFVAMCLIQPGLKKLQNKFRDSKPHNIGFIIITALFMIDLIARIWLGSNYKG